MGRLSERVQIPNIPGFWFRELENELLRPEFSHVGCGDSVGLFRFCEGMKVLSRLFLLEVCIFRYKPVSPIIKVLCDLYVNGPMRSEVALDSHWQNGGPHSCLRAYEATRTLLNDIDLIVYDMAGTTVQDPRAQKRPLNLGPPSAGCLPETVYVAICKPEGLSTTFQNAVSF